VSRVRRAEEHAETRIFVAGATGVIGIRLLPLLVAAGHRVMGMTRTVTNASRLAELGAEPLVCDVYDAEALTAAVVAFAPQIVVHELTDLPDEERLLSAHAAGNARMRRDGTRNLVAAARAAGSSRFLAQSVAWDLAGESAAAKADLEAQVLAVGGVVLRYGQLYGPGTYYENELPEAPRIHVDEAARRTVEALAAPPGIVTITDARGSQSSQSP
jgi:nucleoside-diphosphate-sugar epimerase